MSEVVSDSIENALHKASRKEHGLRIKIEPGFINGDLSIEMFHLAKSHRAKVIEQMRQEGADKGNIEIMEQCYKVHEQNLPIAALKFEKLAIKIKELKNEIQTDLDNYGRLLELRESMGGRFVDTLREHTDELTEMLAIIIDKVESRGTDYFMAGDEHNEELAQDIERLLEKMKYGKQMVSDYHLRAKSVEYGKIRNDTTQEISGIFNRDDLVRFQKDPEEGYHNLEIEKINMIDGMLPSNISTDKIKDSIFRLTKNGFEHRAGSLVSDMGKYVPKDENGIRKIDKEFEGYSPILKTEYLFGTLIRTMRATINAKVIANKYYLDKNAVVAEQDEQDLDWSDFDSPPLATTA
jgi:hypothetical protein